MNAEMDLSFGGILVIESKIIVCGRSWGGLKSSTYQKEIATLNVEYGTIAGMGSIDKVGSLELGFVNMIESFPSLCITLGPNVEGLINAEIYRTIIRPMITESHHTYPTFVGHM